jgi:hypothetical protein
VVNLRTLLFLTFATLSAQNALPPNEQALKNAIAGIGKRPVRLAPQQVRLDAPADKICSIPLQSVPVDSGREYTGRQIRPAETRPMPQVNLPAPPCETATL